MADAGPPLVRSGEPQFRGLGETRLARPVPADNQREARPGLQAQRRTRADPAKSLDRNRPQVCAMRLKAALLCGRRRRGDPFAAYRTCELVITYQRGNDEVSGRVWQAGRA
jgi:hypothetical protein